MSLLQQKAESFKTMYEKFVNGCDALEQSGAWDTDASGEMEGYYFNDIMCVILHLISADGLFADEEAQYVNDVFGFRYSADELREIYRTEGDDIQKMIDAELPAGYEKMKAISTGLAGHYRALMLMICDIISGSDGIIHSAEGSIIGKVRETFGN